MKFSYAIIVALGAFLTSCSQKSNDSSYTLSVAIPDGVEQGAYAFLINYDTDAIIDSAIVNGDTLYMSGAIDSAIIARVKFPSARRTFILEPGTIAVDSTGTASGTKLNEELESWSDKINSIESSDSDSTFAIFKEACLAEIGKDNVVGYMALLQIGYYLDATELDSIISKNPAYGDYIRVKHLRKAKIHEAATSAGCQYADFEICDSTTNQVVKLSDYVKPGEYTLVDFWASWCRYCIMEIPSLKSLLDKYSDKGLNIVGVAVWDEADASQNSIEKHGVTWPQILNVGNIPTDTYGVTGIPQIFLIDPDGKIVARNLQGERLTAVVDSVMTQNAE